MGDTDYFYIYDLFEDSKYKFVEKRENIVRDMDHADIGKMQRVINIVKNADCVVAKCKSPNFVNIANKTRYQPVVVKADKISDVLMVFQESFQEIYNYVTRRRNGECFDVIPVLQ
jgi:hypothetical protein